MVLHSVMVMYGSKQLRGIGTARASETVKRVSRNGQSAAAGEPVPPCTIPIRILDIRRRPPLIKRDQTLFESRLLIETHDN